MIFTWLNKHREWWLPIFTTFLGVFSAAWITLEFEKDRNESKINQLLMVAKKDTCSSWISTPEAGKISTFNVSDLPSGVAVPEITLALIKDNATALGEFHPDIANQIVVAVSNVKVESFAYPRIYNDLRSFDGIEELPGAKQDVIPYIKKRKEKLLSEARDSLMAYEDNLGRLAFLLKTELEYRESEISEDETNSLVTSNKYTVDCKTK